MKKIKTAVLSVLLLSFCFISFHDHLMVDNHAHEISLTKIDLEKEQALSSVVHDSLHHLLVYFEVNNLSFDPLQSENPSFIQSTLSSHTAAVLLRPPLS